MGRKPGRKAPSVAEREGFGEEGVNPEEEKEGPEAGRPDLGAASRKQQAVPGEDGLRGRAPRKATCRGGSPLALPKLFVSSHWRRRGSAASRLAEPGRTRRGQGREEEAAAEPRLRAGQSRAPPAPGPQPEPRPPPCAGSGLCSRMRPWPGRPSTSSISASSPRPRCP